MKLGSHILPFLQKTMYLFSGLYCYFLLNKSIFRFPGMQEAFHYSPPREGVLCCTEKLEVACRATIWTLWQRSGIYFFLSICCTHFLFFFNYFTWYLSFSWSSINKFSLLLLSCCVSKIDTCNVFFFYLCCFDAFFFFASIMLVNML